MNLSKEELELLQKIDKGEKFPNNWTLKRLVQNGYVKEIKTLVDGSKIGILTEKGKEFLKNQQ